MRNYVIGEEYKYDGRTVTKGTQKKYYRNGYFYKVNSLGNEGITEYIVYSVLKNSSLSRNMIVPYEYCRINGKIGCRSKSFLVDGRQFVTMSTLHERVCGTDDISDRLMRIDNAKSRLEYLLDIAEIAGIPRGQFMVYLNVLLSIDLLIENVDRHAHNYGVVYDNRGKRYSIAPVFDNGYALGTARNGNKTACTISGSFEEQVVAFGYPIKSAFRINYTAAYRELDRIEKEYGRRIEIETMRKRLEDYKGIFKSR